MTAHAIQQHRERPILFSAPMVRAILEGRKTQTRRILKGSAEFKGPYSPAYLEAHRDAPGWASICPHGSPGDRLWVKETFWSYSSPTKTINLRASYVDRELSALSHSFTAYKAAWGDKKPSGCLHWKPSIFMPRHLSRITLEITEVRVQRVQDITRDDARAEGIPETWGDARMLWGDYAPRERANHLWDNATSVQNFAWLWDSINSKTHPWESNPWVWAISFRRPA